MSGQVVEFTPAGKVREENRALQEALMIIFEHTNFPVCQFLEIIQERGLHLYIGDKGPEIRLARKEDKP